MPSLALSIRISDHGAIRQMRPIQNLKYDHIIADFLVDVVPSCWRCGANGIEDNGCGWWERINVLRTAAGPGLAAVVLGTEGCIFVYALEGLVDLVCRPRVARCQLCDGDLERG